MARKLHPSTIKNLRRRLDLAVARKELWERAKSEEGQDSERARDLLGKTVDAIHFYLKPWQSLFNGEHDYRELIKLNPELKEHASLYAQLPTD